MVCIGDSMNQLSDIDWQDIAFTAASAIPIFFIYQRMGIQINSYFYAAIFVVSSSKLGHTAAVFIYLKILKMLADWKDQKQQSQ